MKLIPITVELAASEPVRQSDLLRSVCDATVAMYPDGLPPSPWMGYLAEDQGAFVGTCAFKAPPDAEGVEIAYFTFPGHEGQGVATRMAAALVDLAARHGVFRVRAQTMPEPNASTRILEKLGFRCSGSVVHPDDGEVWAWQKG